MGSPTFQFKQFSIAHDRCAMKVGTDGVLLGAWAEVPKQGRVLDVGTGTGLIALMVAQRFLAVHVKGIDIDESAVEQARENVASSPFASRVEICLQSFQELDATGESFDAIVSNPPYFEESLLPPDAQRSLARHAHSLNYEELAAGAGRLLREGGLFNVVLPAGSFDDFRRLCVVHGLNLKRWREVQGTANKPPKRVLATFVKGEAEWLREKPLVLTCDGRRSEDYAALTRDFYLW